MSPDHPHKRKQTLSTYDHLWRLTQGDQSIDTQFWKNQVESIISEEELCIRKDWFAGRKVLDLGCGGGRWTYGFLKLGAEVTAVDASEHAIATVAKKFASPHLKTVHANIFDLPKILPNQKFDLVFSWGVLHHTGDTPKALEIASQFLKDDGVLYVYLYGIQKWKPLTHQMIRATRLLLSPFPTAMKFNLFKLVFGEFKAGVLTDVMTPRIAHRYSHEEVKNWIRELGFKHLIRTIESPDIFLKAHHNTCSALPFFTVPKTAPYWFERWKKDNYFNLAARKMRDPDLQAPLS